MGDRRANRMMTVSRAGGLLAKPLKQEPDMSRVMTRFVHDESGADMIEYAFLAGLLSLACFLALSDIGANITGMFSKLGAKMTQVLP
jgi:pilus assembly protein Flp/PilA